MSSQTKGVVYPREDNDRYDGSDSGCRGPDFSFLVVLIRKEVKRMKIVSLCGSGGCCPVVKIADAYVEIGEKDNVCVLTQSEWEALKQKILNREL